MVHSLAAFKEFQMGSRPITRNWILYPAAFKSRFLSVTCLYDGIKLFLGRLLGQENLNWDDQISAFLF